MALPSALQSDNSILWMAEFRVECLMYAHRWVQLVPSLTLPGYSLPPTTSIHVRRFINIKWPSPLKPQTFLTGMCAPTTLSPTLLTERQDQLKQTSIGILKTTINDTHSFSSMPSLSAVESSFEMPAIDLILPLSFTDSSSLGAILSNSIS